MVIDRAARSPCLRLVPLGGLGRIGGNMMLYETEHSLVVVDCGVNFPGRWEPGVDLLLPDIRYLLARKQKLKAYFVTHGHEDHIGALPYVLSRAPAPVYATRFTTALINYKLAPHGGAPKGAAVQCIADHERIELNDLSVTALPVTHSIPDAIALAVETPAGVVIHTGDFKIDPTPLDDRLTDLEAFRRWGDRGVIALLSDSTNAEKAGHTWSEKEVRDCLREEVVAAPQRVVISTFSTHIHRVQSIVDAALAAKRKITVVGRSIEQAVQIARETGHLRVNDRDLVETDRLRAVPRPESLVIASGCQGEPRSTLSRIALGQHAHVRLKPQDSVIFSSRRIPGNERAIGALVNNLLRQGVDVRDDHVAKVHTSGHGFREEQKEILLACRPHYFVPLHGEYRHLLSHARLAHECGVPPARVFVLEDGRPLDFERGAARSSAIPADPVESGYDYLDGGSIGYTNDLVLRDRRILGDSGFVVCAIAVNKRGRVVGQPEILTRGVVHVDENAELLAEAADSVKSALARLGTRASMEQQETAARSALRRFFRRGLGRRPLIIPRVVDV